MSQSFEIVVETAKILKNADETGFRSERPNYIIFYGRNENGSEVGVEYDEKDSIDQKNIAYLMSILDERKKRVSNYDRYWSD